MADYWKSQPRKFCQYCKCWIADNKPSIEFHERGKNHKENVAAKISEIKKKSVEKAKQDKRMSKEFAKMEEAANKAYEEDLKRMEMESQGLTYTAPTPAAPQPQVTPQPAKHKQKKKDKSHSKPRQHTGTQVWVQGCSDEGLTYYYNTITGESQWDKPQGFQGRYPAPPPFGLIPSSSGYPWVEAVSPEGYTYYYNTESGESSWEKPAGFPSSVASESSPDIKEGSKSEEEPPSSGEKSSDQQADEETQIGLGKRKAETDPSDKDAEFQAGDEQASVKTTEEECKTEEGKAEITAGAQKNQEKVQVKRRAVNPYGVWEQIKQEQDPYAKVDLQLPEVEGTTTSAPAELPPEPKPKFKERVITSLGEQGGPASFRKSKTHNGKSRSLRQRDNDD